MFTQIRFAPIVAAAFAVAAANAQHEAMAAAGNGQPHPADVPAQAEGAGGQAGEPSVAPGDQRQEQQSARPPDTSGPTSDDAGAGSAATRRDGASGKDASATPEDALGGKDSDASGSSDSKR
jgi:hypothetical protein